MVEFKIISEGKCDYSTKVTTSQEAFQYLRPIVEEQLNVREGFWAVYLNRSNKILGHYLVSLGGISGTLTDVRLVMKNAIDKLASSIILCHNHPSGNPRPSESDITMTKKIKEAAKLFDITLLDHLIITEDEYFSFADEGLN